MWVGVSVIAISIVTQTTCDGDIDFCEKPNVLKTYLFEQRKREGGLEWERRRNVLFSGNQKV